MSKLRQLLDQGRVVASKVLSPQVRNALKVIWMILVTVFVVRYMVKNWDSITDTIKSFSFLVLFGTVVVTIIGKVIVSVHSQLITKVNGREFTFRESFWMYSASDLVKYIPGGLWNALARVRLYTNMGMSASASTKSFALEKYWMVVGALATGALALTPQGLRGIGVSDNVALVSATRVVLFALWVLLVWMGGRFTGQPLVPLVVIRSLSEQVIMAIFFGLGVWIPLQAVDAGVSPVVAIGAFSMGRGLGYLAVFAPAGIGVREVVTLWALAGSSATSQAMGIALAVNRVMTFIADLASFGLSFGVKPRRNGSQ